MVGDSSQIACAEGVRRRGHPGQRCRSSQSGTVNQTAAVGEDTEACIPPYRVGVISSVAWYIPVPTMLRRKRCGSLRGWLLIQFGDDETKV